MNLGAEEEFEECRSGKRGKHKKVVIFFTCLWFYRGSLILGLVWIWFWIHLLDSSFQLFGWKAKRTKRNEKKEAGFSSEG